ncbi:MmyB family transcriptional regulator [Streptomyces lydicus]|uniref:MmyB family transcriptional regulator n=1 Tax=Streptomyces lydicus TaxID=47763 RepID=UPI003830E992
MNRDALKGLLDARRDAIDPVTVGLQRPQRQGRRAPGLAQDQVDSLAGYGRNTYTRLVNGKIDEPSFELLSAYALALRLDEQEWTAMCNYARGQAPPFTLYEDSGLEVPAVWRDVIQGCTGHVSYITDRAWNLLATNKAFDEIYEALERPTNMMRWMLLSPAARGIPGDPDRPGILTDWATAWAPYVLPQLRAARARFRRDRTLFEIEQDVVADPITGPLYEERANASVHPDGDRRPQLHPLYGPGWVTICAAEPLGSAGARVMGVFFTPGAMPGDAPAPLRASS